CKSFASVGKVMSLGCTVVSTVTRAKSLVRSAPLSWRHPQALGQEKFQLAAEAFAPMAQVRALVRKLVLEELISGEVMEVWIIDPAFAHAFVGQSVNMLGKKSPITNCVAIPGRPPLLYSGAISPSMNPPVDLAREQH